MKKIGLLILALVVALGGLGAGYAMWSDDVTITGTVSTGSINLGINDRGTNDDGVNSFADPNCVPGDNSEGKDVAKMVSTNVGTPEFSIDNIQFYGSITETFENVYPWYGPRTVIRIGNGGTVPVKIDAINFVGTGYNLLPWMNVSWTVTDENGDLYSGTGLEALQDAVQYQQIAGGEFITVDLEFCFNQHINNDVEEDMLPQGVSATYTITVNASQWNEVAGTPTYPQTTID